LASWYKDVDFANPPDFPNHEYDYNPLGKLDPEMIGARNKAVEYFFVQKYGSLPEELWHNDGIVGDIIRDIGADLLRSIVFRTSITCDYDNNDPKFKTGMPDEVYTTMTHCLQIGPSIIVIVL
jgi:hypothetical protein